MSERSKWAPGAEALAAAAQAIARVTVDGRSSDDAFVGSERAERAIALGTIRWYLRLAPAVDSLLTNPKKLPPELRALLVCAAHQIEYSRNPPQATVHIAVDAARALGHPRATGVVNAVLRRFVAERGPLLARIDNKPSRRVAHPEWLFKALRAQWPDQAEAIFAANNAHPPMVLRVADVPAYLTKLANAGIAARAIEWSESAIELEKPVPVTALPGFADGMVSVQDAGAQLAAVLLDAKPGMHVLDACAAPGGKTGHILQRTPDLAELVALDVDEQRLKRVEENLARLKVSATLVAADLRTWESPERFDRVLVDVPCSSTGVIRRHPDIKLLRRETDIPALAGVQLEIARAAYRCLKPGGRMLYATCSVLKEENVLVLENFLRAEPSARVIELSPGKDVAPGAIRGSCGVQWLPGAPAGTDGFYYACVEKTTFGT